MFNKHCQRAEKDTLSASSDSELDGGYSVEVQDHKPALRFNCKWDTRQIGIQSTFNWIEMDRLPQTKGKGVLMFAQRRKRMDEIAAEHEEMRRKGIPVEGVLDSMPDITKSFPTEESYNSQAYMDTNAKQDKENLQQPQYQEQQQLYQQQQYQQQAYLQSTNAMNGVDIMSKALVSNRTAKPFLGGQNKVPAPFLAIHSVSSPTPKKPENIFKVPVPVNTSPHVWSPTGDIIASRDERIAVPAIKTGILPDSKRRGVKTPSSTNEALKGDRNPQLESKGDRRSFIESGPEEDYLSLGAEACNFMQAPRVKHKIPPPVAPKPTINPSCPPWSAGSSSQNQAPRSPMPVSSPSPAGIPKKVPPQQPWVSGPQPAPETWTPSQPLTQKRPQLSSQPPWISEQQRVPVSMPARAQPKTPWMKPHTDASSVASCPPPQRGSSYFHAPKVPSPSFRGNASDASMCPSSDGPKFKGKGAELFARRHARMERFVVDDETVQANKSKSNSPTPSLPSTWKLSSNIRAPPPTSYNPILSPSYPPGAVKQPPATSPKIKSKAKNDKPKTAPKHLNTLDVMKHQPYQLDSSLFMYNASPEGMGPSPKASPVPPPESTIQGFAYPHSPMYSPSQLPVKPSSPVKSNPPVSVPYPFVRESNLLNESQSPSAHDDLGSKLLSNSCPSLANIHHSSGKSGANAHKSPISATPFSSKNALPVAPKPRFSAKKTSVGSKQWKPVAMQH
ncbi:synaptopodin-2 [Denticeps clupeoides]|uniref:synaptopodin-2 n=1 Tax=Denticeps clupeoides TaxID=299321 RepID=UPI0010A2CF02|nr:synaptopodin-2 [Denticeps clupeoides]